MNSTQAKKLTYQEMIENCIITLGERKGSTRQAIIKCMMAKYPEADSKQQLLARMKKLT
jgi:linker histone H1 and H5 family